MICVESAGRSGSTQRNYRYIGRDLLVLFDYGASHLFVTKHVASMLGGEKGTLNLPLIVKMPSTNEVMMVSYIKGNVSISGQDFVAKLTVCLKKSST